ncbi:hypothetical protein AB0M38_29670 [Streptomyces sp. NPDC051742]|uniref:hypothetical protein n=1 Tax=unclassified Streptomyces TaxID=2593676 RepID=UPI00341C7B63
MDSRTALAPPEPGPPGGVSAAARSISVRVGGSPPLTGVRGLRQMLCWEQYRRAVASVDRVFNADGFDSCSTRSRTRLWDLLCSSSAEAIAEVTDMLAPGDRRR